MTFATKKSNSDPVQNYSLNFRKHKGQNLAWKNPIIATRKLVASCQKSTWQQGSLSKHSQQSSQSFIFFQKDYHSYEQKEVGGYSRQSFVRRSSVTSGLQNGYQNGTSLRSRRTRTWWIISLGQRTARYCWRRLENMEHKFSQKDIGLSFFKKEAVRKELNTVWLTKFLGLPSSDSRTLWWYSVNAGTDGVHVCSLQLERVHLS